VWTGLFEKERKATKNPSHDIIVKRGSVTGACPASPAL
jgi:hypothetical protein